jgi:hypothetical protein
MGGTQILSTSDLLCFVRAGGGFAAPQALTLKLNRSNIATLAWSAPGVQSDYVLIAAPLNGARPRIMPLGSQTTAATDDTLGAPTCYLVVAHVNGATLGLTNLLCGIPGIASRS